MAHSSESPGLNPTESIWHEMKQYINVRSEATSKAALLLGIKEFWTTVTVESAKMYSPFEGHTRSDSVQGF